MATKFRIIMENCAQVIGDEAFRRMHPHRWMEWTNDAQRAICLVRPDAKSVVTSFQLVAGTSKQPIPTTARRLLGLVRNMGDDGATPGKAIRGPVPQEDMDSSDPDWHTTAGSYVKEYVYDIEQPKFFWIRPHVATPWYLEGKFAENPAEVDDHNDTLDIDDVYAPAVIEWNLYRAFSPDSEHTPNNVRAMQHLQTFFQLLGIKTGADRAIAPGIIEFSRQLLAARTP